MSTEEQGSPYRLPAGGSAWLRLQLQIFLFGKHIFSKFIFPKRTHTSSHSKGFAFRFSRKSNLKESDEFILSSSAESSPGISCVCELSSGWLSYFSMPGRTLKFNTQSGINSTNLSLYGNMFYFGPATCVCCSWNNGAKRCARVWRI